jgi:sRNA-binding carbon storage regulator CsrA
MLKLKIRANESVRVGEAVIHNSSKTHSIMIAIDAPREVPIVRTELEERAA